MSFFNSSPFWDIYDAFDREFFGPESSAIRVSPRLLNKKRENQNESKALTKKDGANNENKGSLFRSLVNDSIFKPDFDLVPPVDLIDKENQFELHASIPGVPKDQINLDFDNETKELTISGTVPEVNVENNEKGRYYRELRTGSFERRIRFGNEAELDVDKINADYKNGILTVIVPKVVSSKPKENIRKIAISSS